MVNPNILSLFLSFYSFDVGKEILIFFFYSFYLYLVRNVVDNSWIGERGSRQKWRMRLMQVVYRCCSVSRKENIDTLGFFSHLLFGNGNSIEATIVSSDPDAN